MAENPYPNLGWNPVPGIPGEVQSLKTKVNDAAKALRSSHQQIQRLLGESDHWEGDAASAFHDALDGELPEYMKNAARSLEKAVDELHNWDGSLSSNRNLAEKYDKEAKEKKEAAGTAEERYKEANKNPDLKLGDKEYPSEAEAGAATARLRAAEDRLKDAADSVEKAKNAYSHVIKKAKELEKDHTADANKVADKLDEADDKLAPKEPGWFSKTLDAIGDALAATGQFLLDHAGTIGAIAGLLALFPTPLAPAFAAIAVVASAASLSKNLASEDFRDALTGKYGWKEGVSAGFSLGADALGMVPGVSALAKAGTEVGVASAAAREGGEVMSVGARASTFTSETSSAFSHKVLETATDPDTGWKAYSLGGANVAANGVSSLETAGVLPDDGPSHDGAEAAKAGIAMEGAPGLFRGLGQDVGNLTTSLRL